MIALEETHIIALTAFKKNWGNVSIPALSIIYIYFLEFR